MLADPGTGATKEHEQDWTEEDDPFSIFDEEENEWTEDVFTIIQNEFDAMEPGPR